MLSSLLLLLLDPFPSHHSSAAMHSKAPPSPSLNSQAGSVISFSMQPNELRLVPLERDKISEQLRDAENIRYAAYRAAAKLEILQSGLKLDNIRFGVVCNVFHHHGMTSGENDVVLDVSEANDIVSDIFFAASKGRVYHTPPMDVEALTAAALKYAFLIYDNQGTGGILVKSLKVFFVLLCNGRLRDKFLYLFRQFEDSSNSVSKKALVSMLNTVAHFAEFFGEAISFGLSLVEGSANQCFAHYNNTNSNDAAGLTEDTFTRWLLQEPQIMVWLPTHFRMVSAKGIRHGLRCNHCKLEDIIGMR